MNIDATHDPSLKSWVASANDGRTDFPIQNLPHGVFRRRGADEPFRGGVAIGDQILDLGHAIAAGVFTPDTVPTAQAAAAPTLNGLMAMGRPAWRGLRAQLSQALSAQSPHAEALRACLVPQSTAEHALPAQVGDYTDFFTSYDHMLNMGRLFQPDRPELPQFKSLPIAYHGRASTLEISGTHFERPWGQFRPAGAGSPVHAPSQRLDYEMEIACWIGPGNRRGQAIDIDTADDHLFGVSLLNDWSLRDVQGWEALPLGPFLAKNFLSSVSPWIVTWEALAPFRCPVRREVGDPPLLPYLVSQDGNARGGLDLCIEVQLTTQRQALEPMRLSLSNTAHAYWGFAQMLAHHTVNGCAMAPGDLIGSGTHSGPGAGESGCLMELSHGGRRPVQLPNGETRTLLEDGDTVILRAWAERAGAVRIGLGECRGTVLPPQPGL